ncbi:MAG: PQQ-binding-like beta-propeller repeat protein [Verrucomicrobiaceae bacterium]
MKALLTFCLLLPAVSLGDDWGYFLGPEGNGKSGEEVRTDWGSTAPPVLWSAEVGKGCSSIVVKDGLAITLGNEKDTDTVWCFDATTGEVKWKDSYEEDLEPKFYTGGPGATPTIEGELVYVLSKSGRLACYDLKSGEIRWRKSYKDDFDGKMPTWGYSASPTVYGDLLLCLPCGKKGTLVALDKTTGEVKWKTTDKARAGYAAPVIADHKGKKTAFVFQGRNLVAYDLEDEGEVLFTYGWRTPYDVNASNPVYQDGLLYLSSGYGMGYAVLDVTGREPKLEHRDRELRMIFQNAIPKGGDLVGVFGDKGKAAEAFRMEMKTGKFKWRAKIPGSRGSTIMLGDQLIVLSETGELVFGTDTGTKFKETGKHEILPKLCWAPPALAEGRLYARSNGGKLVCVDLRK